MSGKKFSIKESDFINGNWGEVFSDYVNNLGEDEAVSISDFSEEVGMSICTARRYAKLHKCDVNLRVNNRPLACVVNPKTAAKMRERSKGG